MIQEPQHAEIVVRDHSRANLPPHPVICVVQEHSQQLLVNLRVLLAVWDSSKPQPVTLPVSPVLQVSSLMF